MLKNTLICYVKINMVKQKPIHIIYIYIYVYDVFCSSDCCSSTCSLSNSHSLQSRACLVYVHYIYDIHTAILKSAKGFNVKLDSIVDIKILLSETDCHSEPKKESY
jgi:hypothetical protein